jgi:hypothetical protein
MFSMILIYTVSETCVWGSPLEVCREVFWVAAKAEEESEDRFRLPWRHPLGAALQTPPRPAWLRVSCGASDRKRCPISFAYSEGDAIDVVLVAMMMFLAPTM